MYKPDLQLGPNALIPTHSQACWEEYTSSAPALQFCVRPADLEPMGQERAGSLPSCLCLVALILLVLLLILSHDVWDLPLSHLAVIEMSNDLKDDLVILIQDLVSWHYHLGYSQVLQFIHCSAAFANDPASC